MTEELQQQEKIIRMFPAQYGAIAFTTQFCAAVAGVQSGKTFAGVHWAGLKISEYPKGTGIIVAPTYKILQQATMRKFFDVLPRLRKHYREQKGEIILPTGGIVYVRSADSPLGIEGITANWIWLDEGGMTSVLTWTILRSRVSMTGGQILITTTPYNMGWLYKEFFVPWKEGKDKNLSFFTWKSTDNPQFSKEYFEQERTRLNPAEFARRYEGKFEKMTGLVWDIPDEQIIDPKDIMVKAEARVIGVDWGYENPAAIVVAYYYERAWYIVDEWKQAKRVTSEIIQVLKNKFVEHRATLIYPDPAEPDRIEEYRREGLPVMETNKDIKGGISLVQQLIRERRFFVFNNCKEFIDEASMYHYEEPQEEKAAKDEPVKFNDHLCDAARYAIYSYNPIKPKMMQASESVKPYYEELGF